MEIITKKDLELLKTELVKEMERLIEKSNDLPVKFLVSSEVKKLFHISETKLYELRRDGKIPFIKVDGKFLYNYQDVLTAFQNQTISESK